MASDLPELLDDLNIDLKSIDDPNLRLCFVGLLNIIQEMNNENKKLKEQVQKQKDEIARLKGEQGKPDIKANKDPENKDHSSNKRRKKKKKTKKKKKGIEVDRTVACAVDPETLPEDAQYKGTEATVIQDVIFRRDNVSFEREKYYSPSLKQTIYGPLPPEYEGHKFGPGVRTLVLTLYYATGTSEPKILELLNSIDVHMSAMIAIIKTSIISNS